MLPDRSQTTPLRRLVTLLATALLAFGLAHGDAFANGTRTVKDAKFETPTLSRNGRLDIVEATASRFGPSISHTVTMRAKVKRGSKKERPSITINTKGGRTSSYEYIVFGSTIFKVPKSGPPTAIGVATLTAKGRTWTFDFDAAQIPGLPSSYGWAAITQKGHKNKIVDVAPEKGYANSPG